MSRGKWLTRMLAMAVLAVFIMVGCGQSGSQSPGSGNGGDGPYKFIVIIKATDSAFWQQMVTGAQAAADEMGDQVSIDVQGPPSESDIEQQVSILENAVSQQPDGILLASTSSDATVPIVERSMNQNIPVVLVDNKINTDQYVSFLATDNEEAGGKAADAIVEFAKKDAGGTQGKLGLIGALAGVQVLEARDRGFTNRLNEIAPDIEILGPRYVNNDITQAASTAEDMLTANPDMLGFFADNNHTGDGVARVISQRNLGDQKAVVAFDADKQEVNALEGGAIDALVVQDPYLMGFKGINFLVDHLQGEDVPKNVNTGSTVVTQENFNDPEIQGLLFPDTRKPPTGGETTSQ